MRMSLLALGSLLIAGLFGTANTASAGSISELDGSLLIESSDDLVISYGGRLQYRWDRYLVESATFYTVDMPVVEPEPIDADLERRRRLYTGVVIRQIEPPPTPIPEPRAALAFVAGLLLTALVLRKR